MVFLELMVRVELNCHFPDIVIDTAFTETESMIIALHLVEVETSEVADINGGMTPEQEVASVLIPFLNNRRSSLYICRDIPYIIFSHTLQVAQPEEHAIGLQISRGSDRGERYEDCSRVLLVQP